MSSARRAAEAQDFSRPGTLVRARGREWVVQPGSTRDELLVRPVSGLDEEETGILPAIEEVTSATFSLPTREDLGDFGSGRLLRDAARLSTRAVAGPFRSLGRIAVEPRPYQLVPLLMALRLDPVRLLVADDVGVGKTIETLLIARELLDRGEIRRVAVLCPPHLAEQWQREMAEKFHLDAVAVLAGTVKRLERGLPLGVSVFDRYPFTVVSTDFIKAPRRAEDFAHRCPELVIVDEAHGCTPAGGGRGGHQRHELLRRLAVDPGRHLVLVTATPHSGNEEAFRALLGLLDESLANLPTDLDRAEREGARRRLARHLVQRRRADIRHFLETDTSFPERYDREVTYSFDPAYRELFEDIVDFLQEYVTVGGEGHEARRRKRVRYWSALALLRCFSSSPAAAVATLRNRAAVDGVPDDELDETGRRTVLDAGEDEDVIVDFSPGSGEETADDRTRRKLLEFARRIEALRPEQDRKLSTAAAEVRALLADGFRPVVFCRFVDTAEYVAQRFRELLPKGTKIEHVTGKLPPAEREQRIADLVAEDTRRVLVATDCLSEGINLQEHFDAVFHYDLAWNPTRHEQREGRVDRFGQPRSEVRVVTFYGADNPVDGVILDVLIRKHKAIRNDLGVAVAVPGSSEEVVETLFEGAVFRERTGFGARQLTLDFVAEIEDRKERLHREWERARDREKASRSRFAQHALRPELVERELAAVRETLGDAGTVRRFVEETLRRAGVEFGPLDGGLEVRVTPGTPRALRQAIGHDTPFRGRFDLPLREGEVYLGRTGPVVEGLANWILDQALDPVAREARRPASRCGVIVTGAVDRRTVLLVARFRYQLRPPGRRSRLLLVEEVVTLACRGPAEDPEWLPPAEAGALLGAEPAGNLLRTTVDQQLGLLLDALPRLREALARKAEERAMEQVDAHDRVRQAARLPGRTGVEPIVPVDVLGAYVLLPRLD